MHPFKGWLAFWGLASAPSRHQSKEGHSSAADATSCGEILFQHPEYKIHTVSHLGASPETVLNPSMQPRAPKPGRNKHFCRPLLHFVFSSKLYGSHPALNPF